MSKYDIETLKAITISEVLEHFQVDHLKGNSYTCPYDHAKPTKLTVYPAKNICKCHNCDVVKGDSIAIARYFHNDDFKSACEDLHEAFGIPYLDNSDLKRTETKKYVKPQPKAIEYLSFDKTRGFKHIEVDDYIEKYTSLEKRQQLKLVYTHIYRYSLSTKRESINNYYESRGIENNQHLSKLGFLSKNNIIHLVGELKRLFPVEDLVEFGILNNSENKKFKHTWKQIKNAILVPAFDVYTDLIEGFMLRPIDSTSNKWFTGKESRLSVPEILKPLPFGTGYKVLSGDCDIYITEGHIDALSLPSDKCFIAAPGIHSFENEQLGLLRGRNIKLAFDQDDAGQKAAFGYTEFFTKDEVIVVLNNNISELGNAIKKLSSQDIKFTSKRTEGFRDQLIKAGATSVEILSWDKNLGKDLNDLLINGNIDEAIGKQI